MCVVSIFEPKMVNRRIWSALNTHIYYFVLCESDYAIKRIAIPFSAQFNFAHYCLLPSKHRHFVVYLRKQLTPASQPTVNLYLWTFPLDAVSLSISSPQLIKVYVYIIQQRTHGEYNLLAHSNYKSWSISHLIMNAPFNHSFLTVIVAVVVVAKARFLITKLQATIYINSMLFSEQSQFKAVPHVMNLIFLYCFHAYKRTLDERKENPVRSIKCDINACMIMSYNLLQFTWFFSFLLLHARAHPILRIYITVSVGRFLSLSLCRPTDTRRFSLHFFSCPSENATLLNSLVQF